MVNIPPLNRSLKISEQSGVASDDFARYFNKTISQLQKQILDIQTATAAANSAQATANAASSQAATAAATASSAGSGLPSGALVGVPFDALSSSLATIATIDLIGVVAGNLRFDTTRFYADSNTILNANVADSIGAFSITEKLTSGAGSENTLLSGTWTAFNAGFGDSFTYLVVNIDDVGMLDAARPVAGITGNVTYRLKVSKDVGQADLIDAFADFRAAQA